LLFHSVSRTFRLKLVLAYFDLQSVSIIHNSSIACAAPIY
jgi:hypothetical protein